MSIKDINLYKFKEKEFTAKNIFYYAQQTKYEFRGVMINKFNLNRKESKKAWKRMINAFNFKPIRTAKKSILQYKERTREANALLVKKRDIPKFQMTYQIGESDVDIIANFLKKGISRVYTSDRAFHETCKILGFNSKMISLYEYANMEKRP